jgi:hypothetical protein
MAWGFWSASTVSDRGRSPRRATTTTSSAMYYQPQQQQQQQQQCNVTMNQCVQQEPEPIQVMSIPVQQQKQSVCGSPCQSVCHTPTCHSPSCQSGTTGENLSVTFPTTLESPEPQQCTDEQCQEPECQYNMQQQQLVQEQLALQQQQQQQMQNERFQHQQPIFIQPVQTQPHIHQIHYTYSRRTSLDSNALDVRYLFVYCASKNIPY